MGGIVHCRPCPIFFVAACNPDSLNSSRVLSIVNMQLSGLAEVQPAGRQCQAPAPKLSICNRLPNRKEQFHLSKHLTSIATPSTTHSKEQSIAMPGLLGKKFPAPIGT